MAEDTTTERTEPRDVRARRRYNRSLGGAMVAYTVLLAVTIVGLNADVGQPLRSVVALLPMLPLALVPVAVVRLLRDLDELQRRIQLEALAVAFAAGSLLTLAYGFLQLAGAPALSWGFVWPVYGASWLAGTLVARRRYDR